MYKIFTLIFIIVFTNNFFAQKSPVSYCVNLKSVDTELKKIKKTDTCIIYYKEQQVGYIYTETIKQKGQPKAFKNTVFNNEKQPVAYLIGESGQIVIKYIEPYQVVYVKGIQFNNVVKQMVEIDKRLTAKE